MCMEKWKEIKIPGIVKIERFIAEFEVWELAKIPYGKFKVKIFESMDGSYTGRTNIMVVDRTNSFCAGIGKGSTVSDALQDTISFFYLLVDEVDDLTEESFKYVDSVDF